MAKATIDDVAKLAGVSIKTVSRVVNREPNVRATTQARVEKAIQELNYRPNLSARNLASQRAHLIGLIYDDPSAYEFPSFGYVIRMQQGTLQACRDANYELLIHPCNYRNTDLDQNIRAFIERTRPAGIVLAAPVSSMPKVADAIAATDTPFVRLSPGESDGEHLAIGTNDREASAEMTSYLASLGHKKIGFIRGIHRAVENRFDGFRDGLEQSGLELNEKWIAAGDQSFESGFECAKTLLEMKDRPTAIFAANDLMAVAVIRVAVNMGIDVPGELSVAGFDDIAFARQGIPTLTTIRQPLSKMSEQAAKYLIDGNGRNADSVETVVVPASLIMRESTGPAPE